MMNAQNLRLATELFHKLDIAKKKQELLSHGGSHYILTVKPNTSRSNIFGDMMEREEFESLCRLPELNVPMTHDDPPCVQLRQNVDAEIKFLLEELLKLQVTTEATTSQD